MRIEFTKMHGAGNDFVLLDRPDVEERQLSPLARRICDRHFGVGADGILVVSESVVADVRMRIFNADGSEAQMCGNGIRCVGKYIYEKGIITSMCPTVETLDGVKKLTLHLDCRGRVDTVTVDMGTASLTCSQGSFTTDTPMGRLRVIPVSTGNPHGIVPVQNVDMIDIATTGPSLENNPFWPDRANIEFVMVDGPSAITQRTWERGVGETLACGTGACAAAFALVSEAKVHCPVTVRLSGGILVIDIDKATGHIMMTGEAAKVFSSAIDIQF